MRNRIHKYDSHITRFIRVLYHSLCQICLRTGVWVQLFHGLSASEVACPFDVLVSFIYFARNLRRLPVITLMHDGMVEFSFRSFAFVSAAEMKEKSSLAAGPYMLRFINRNKNQKPQGYSGIQCTVHFTSCSMNRARHTVNRAP